MQIPTTGTITDDSGFIGIVNPDKYNSFVNEDWQLPQLLNRFVVQKDIYILKSLNITFCNILGNNTRLNSSKDSWPESQLRWQLTIQLSSSELCEFQLAPRLRAAHPVHSIGIVNRTLLDGKGIGNEEYVTIRYQ